VGAGLERLLEALVVAAVAWHALRILVKPAVRTELARHPRALAAAGLVGAVALGVWVWVASGSALVRRGSVGLATAGMLVAAWRARPGYGVRGGLPPGSLGLAHGLDAIDQRDFYLREAERHGPVFKSNQFGRPVLCILGLDRGRELVMRHARHLEAATLPYTRLIPKGALRFMEGRDHRELASLFRPSIAAADLGAAEAQARRAFAEELSRLADASARQQGAGADVREAVEPALFRCLVRILFGLDADGADAGEIRRWTEHLDFGGSGGKAWRDEVQAALDGVTRTLQHAAADPASPIDPTSALGRILAAEPGALEDRTVAGNLILIFRMSQADTAGFLVWMAKMLSDHPVWRERLRAAGRTAGPPPTREPDLGTRLVMETLRLEQSEYLYRKAAETFEFAGFRVPKGWLIRICVQESHRSPDVFEDPTRFDPDRFAGGAPTRSEYAPLGIDTHGCMGTAIIHFLGRIFAEELALGFDWDVVGDGPLERGPRHWLHWRPSSRFRISLRPAS
jgi:cytochrome P450